MSFGKTKPTNPTNPTSTESRPLSPDDVAGYFSKLSDLSGGRLDTFAKSGTTPLTPEQIQAVGGLGATRTMEVNRARGDAVSQIAADPNYSLAQRQRATQLTDREYADRIDALAREIEAAKTGLVKDNATLPREDLAALAQIFFGGRGQRQTSYGGGGGGGGGGFDIGFKLGK